MASGNYCSAAGAATATSAPAIVAANSSMDALQPPPPSLVIENGLARSPTPLQHHQQQQQHALQSHHSTLNLHPNAAVEADLEHSKDIAAHTLRRQQPQSLPILSGNSNEGIDSCASIANGAPLMLHSYANGHSSRPSPTASGSSASGGGRSSSAHSMPSHSPALQHHYHLTPNGSYALHAMGNGNASECDTTTGLNSFSPATTVVSSTIMGRLGGMLASEGGTSGSSLLGGFGNVGASAHLQHHYPHHRDHHLPHDAPGLLDISTL